MDVWEFDTSGDTDWPFNARGWAKEILPDVVSPLTATTFMPVYEDAWRRYVVDVMGALDAPRAERTFVNIFSGRFYCNLSVLRRIGALSSAMSAEQMHEHFAPGQVLPDDVDVARADDAERTARVDAYGIGLLFDPPVAAAREDHELELARRLERRASRSSMAGEALLAEIDELGGRLRELCVRHLMVSGVARASYFGLVRGLREHFGDEASSIARSGLSGRAPVETALPAKELARLATLDGEAARTARGDLMALHGYRGPGEYELAQPSWDLMPSLVDDAVERIRRTPPSRSDTTDASARDRLDGEVRERWPDASFWIDAATVTLPLRELTKTVCVIVVNEIRLHAHEIGARAARQGAIDDAAQVYLLGREELGDLAISGRANRSVVARRRDTMAALADLSPADVVDARGLVGLASTAPAEPVLVEGRDLEGRSAAPGRFSGRARVVRDPIADDPPAVGEILVASTTNPGWTHVFAAAGAVVIEVGNELSHAAIVARELGVPAVVGVSGCMDAILDGDLLEVDGGAGRVRIIERKS